MSKYLKVWMFFGILAFVSLYGMKRAEAYQMHAYGGGPTYEIPSGMTPASGSMANSPTGATEPTPAATQPAGNPGNLGFNAGLGLNSPGNAPLGVVSGIPVSGLFRTDGAPTVYVVINGMLHAFTSEAAFYAWGFRFSAVQIITPAQLGSYVLGAPINIPDGSLVKGSGNSVYIVFNGHKNLATISLASQLGLSPSNTVTIADSDLFAIPDGPAIVLR